MSANVVAKAEGMRLFGFVLGKTGLVAEGKPSFDDWSNVGIWLGHAEQSVHWWIGDWLNYGERSYGEKYSQALDVFGFSEQTCKNDAYVAGSIDLSRRRDKLSWSHHAEVAGIPIAKQEQILTEAENKNWSRREIREAVKAIKADSPTFELCAEVEAIQKLLRERYERWPEWAKHRFIDRLEFITELLQEEIADGHGGGNRTSQTNPGEGAPYGWGEAGTGSVSTAS